MCELTQTKFALHVLHIVPLNAIRDLLLFHILHQSWIFSAQHFAQEPPTMSLTLRTLGKTNQNYETPLFCNIQQNLAELYMVLSNFIF